MDVVILHGDAQEVGGVDRALAIRLANESAKKIRLRTQTRAIRKNCRDVGAPPRIVLAWKNFPMHATPWHLDDRG